MYTDNSWILYWSLKNKVEPLYFDLSRGEMACSSFFRPVSCLVTEKNLGSLFTSVSHLLIGFYISLRSLMSVLLVNEWTLSTTIYSIFGDPSNLFCQNGLRFPNCIRSYSRTSDTSCVCVSPITRVHPKNPKKGDPWDGPRVSFVTNLSLPRTFFPTSVYPYKTTSTPGTRGFPTRDERILRHCRKGLPWRDFL